MGNRHCYDPAALPPIVLAAQSPDVVTAARRYAALGLSVLPLRGKRPALPAWAAYQRQPAARQQIENWAAQGRFHNVGLLCGPLPSGEALVVLDLDGKAAYLAFCQRFPRLADSFSVTTGSGSGHHVYLFTEHPAHPLRALNTRLGHLELRAAGQLVVAPPSRHPRSGRAYTVKRPVPIRRVTDLEAVANWMVGLKLARPVVQHNTATTSPGRLNPALLAAIADRLRAAGYRARGEWLNGPCLFAERHAHGDRQPSFGFNVTSGYGNCFVCGSLLARDIAARLGLDPAAYGGLFSSD